MKIFIDTADINEIKKYAFILDGVTTNPSLMAKTGKSFKEIVKEICEVVDGPISAEAVTETAEEMIKEATELSKIHKNIAVKIPITKEGLKAVSVLSKKGIKTNVTLVFSANQALLAAKAGANYVSPFIGRLDDAGKDGMALIEEIVDIFDNYNFKTEIIVASVRHPMHVIEAAMLGADIATIPSAVLEKMFKHPLTDIGIKKFLDDYKKIPKS